jgi:hypothetical protein
MCHIQDSAGFGCPRLLGILEGLEGVDDPRWEVRVLSEKFVWGVFEQSALGWWARVAHGESI